MHSEGMTPEDAEGRLYGVSMKSYMTTFEYCHITGIILKNRNCRL